MKVNIYGDNYTVTFKKTWSASPYDKSSYYYQKRVRPEIYRQLLKATGFRLLLYILPLFAIMGIILILAVPALPLIVGIINIYIFFLILLEIRYKHWSQPLKWMLNQSTRLIFLCALALTIYSYTLANYTYHIFAQMEARKIALQENPGYTTSANVKADEVTLEFSDFAGFGTAMQAKAAAAEPFANRTYTADGGWLYWLFELGIILAMTFFAGLWCANVPIQIEAITEHGNGAGC